MPRAFLTRKLQFNAAHRYYRPEWSAARNQEVFGPCANPHGHGHNYVLEVTVEGEIDAETGFSTDLGQLDRVLQARIGALLDHQHLNYAVPEFGDGKLIPTSENILVWCWNRLARELEPARLHRLRLYEDPTFYVDYFGGAGPA